jgi:hypothetical protein
MDNLQLIIAVATVAISAGIAWGISQNKLKALEIRLAVAESEHKTDHDLLIRLDEKVNIILQKLDNMDNRITRLEASKA